MIIRYLDPLGPGFWAYDAEVRGEPLLTGPPVSENELVDTLESNPWEPK